MPEAAKAHHCTDLKQELNLRESEVVRLSDIAARLEREGQNMMARAMRRHSEVQQVKLQAQVDALGC